MISLPNIILPKRDFFGLSIDQTSLHGTQINQKGEVICAAEVIFPEELFCQGILTKADVFQEGVKKLRTDGKFITPYVVVTFPEVFAYTREIELPILSSEELSEAIIWRSKELFPFPQDDIYIDWKILRKNNDRYVVSVVASQKKTIDPIVNVLLSVGLKPLNLQPDASTICHLLGLSKDKRAILVEIGRTLAYVTLVEGDQSLFTTIIHVSKGDTTEVYIQNIKQTIQEIVSYYREKGVITEEVLDIVLTGEFGNSQVFQGMPFSVKSLSTPIKNPRFNKAYAVASMKIHNVSQESIINLLPPMMQESHEKERKIQYYRSLLFRSISISASYCVFVLLVLLILLVQKQELEREIKQLTFIVETSQQSSQNLLKINSIAKQIIALAPMRKTPREKIDRIISLIPKDVTLMQIDYDDSKRSFALSGVAKTRDALLEFKSNVDNANEFTKISFPLSLLEASTDISFSVTVTMKE